jgi:bifunctional UDP-N-acetylglucosamine pyrophosphorylase/glucosamine-1-phosphate N-acetyltransferase
MSNNNSCIAIILAAGDGKRMKSDLPKVMHILKGKPIIGHIVSALEKVTEVKKIVVVVSPKHTLVQEYLGDRAEYVVQNEQKGTGHATLCTEFLVAEKSKNVLVVYGDLPCLTSESLEGLVREHAEKENFITMMTTPVEDFAEWRAPFLTYGRILRNEGGEVHEIVEYKDATELQKNIHELNSGIYCFNSNSLFEQLKKLTPENAQGEYYLTDVVKMALEKNERVGTVSLLPQEAIGVTTQEDLKTLENLK